MRTQNGFGWERASVMLKIFKGDDTGGALGRRVSIQVVSELPLAGCVVVFSFCGVVREFEGVESGDEIEVFFSHNDTRTMPLGVGKASLKVRDASGKIRTLTNSLPIKVTSDVNECYGDDAQKATVTIRAVISWENVAHKPFEGQSVPLRTDDDVLAALGTVIEEMGGTVDA